MLIPISWLKEFVEINLPTKELAERLTLAGLEVEGIRQIGEWWDQEKIVIGQILAVRKHPNADHLLLVDVDYGGGTPQQVITGAPNLLQYVGVTDLPIMKVPFARSGAELIDSNHPGRSRARTVLKPATIRGILSDGMICSERELGLSDNHDDILLLEDGAIGTPLQRYLGDEILELGLTPDMARCLSVVGVAREAAALTGSTLKLPPETQAADSLNTEFASYASIIIESKLCHRYTGLLLKDVQVGRTPSWIQTRLAKVGVNSLNNIVDITNYVMFEYGQPMHAFDYDLLVERAVLSGRKVPEIVVRLAQSGEKLTTLDGVERQLDESTLLITDSVGPIALAGVLGGMDTAVHNQTRNVFLEAATFDGINIRRTAQRLKVNTESSHRFTRGVPATLNPIAGKRAADLMCEIGKATLTAGMVDSYPVVQPEQVVYLTEGELKRQLGISISLAEVAAVLQKLDFTTKIIPAAQLSPTSEKATFGLSIDPRESVLAATAPWHRLDIQIPADLIEEVVRMIGYDRVDTTLLADALPPQRRNLLLQTEQEVRNLLIACGLQETINYSLTTPENHEKLKLELPEQSDRYVTLANPLSIHHRVLRRSMLVSAIESLAYNASFTDRQATFELGRVYLPEEGDGVRPHEDQRLSILLTGSRRPLSVHSDPAGAEDFDFFDLKGIVETLVARCGVASNDIEFINNTGTGTFTLNCAEVKIKGETQGIIGELHPDVRAEFDLPDRQVYLAELRVGPLSKPAFKLDIMPPISNYPAMVEDLAFVVAESVTAKQVFDAIRDAAGQLLCSVELFDLYRGEPLPEGHKSLAFELTYQSHTSTLTDVEVLAIRNRIISAVAEKVGGVLRGV